MAVEVRKQLKQGQWYFLISSCDQVPKIQLFDWIILPFPVESFLEEHIFFASFPSWIDRIIQFFLISKIIQFLKRVEVKTEGDSKADRDNTWFVTLCLRLLWTGKSLSMLLFANMKCILEKANVEFLYTPFKTSKV